MANNLEYDYNLDEREAQIEWLPEKKKDTVWYADLYPIVRSFKEEDVLRIGAIVKCPFGRGKKRVLYDARFLGLLGKTCSVSFFFLYFFWHSCTVV